MSLNVKITGEHSDVRVKVTKFGQLVTAPLAYSEPVFQRLTVTGQAYNFIEPLAGHSAVITDIIVSADKNVSATSPADIAVYQSDEVDSLNLVKGIVSPQLIRSSNVSYIGLNMIVPEGRWVNAFTDDAEILITVMFYRVPQEFV